MTRKHFEAIAKIINARLAWADAVQYGYIDATQKIANEMADYFATQNPNFDRARFLKACGLGE